MSLFDVIRYPISSPPTHEELESLPSTMFRVWMSTSDWRSINRLCWTPQWVAAWYARNWNSMIAERDCHDADWQDLEDLKQLIKDWNAE